MKKVRIKTVDGGFCLSVQPFPLFLVAWIRIRNTGTDRSCRIRIQFGSRSTTLVTGSSYQLKFSAKSYFIYCQNSFIPVKIMLLLNIPLVEIVQLHTNIQLCAAV